MFVVEHTHASLFLVDSEARHEKDAAVEEGQAVPTHGKIRDEQVRG